MIYYIENPELYHYGVKGMKWGVRHDPERVGRRRVNAGKKAANKRRGLSKGQKIALGLAAVAAITGTSIYLYKTGKFDKLALLGKQASPIFGNPNLLSTEVKDGLKKVKDFNLAYRPDASNCRQATSEFLCKKAGIDCKAKPAEIINGAVKTGKDPHDLFPESLVNQDMIPRKALQSENNFNSWFATRFKSLCGDEDGFGSLTINLNKRMRHNLSWEVENGQFSIIDTDGVINRSYYSTFANNVNSGFQKAREIEFFRAVGNINMQAVEDQVIRK